MREIQEEAERKCKILRESHNEHEILLGKLMAMIDSHSKSLKNCQKSFEDHEDMLRNIVRYTGEKFEDFEMNANKIKENNVTLDNKIANKLVKIEDQISLVDDKAEKFYIESLQLKQDIQKYMILFAMLPFIGVFLLYFWISFTLPGRILQETKPSFDHLQLNLDNLRRGIESKVANLESDTASELKMSKVALSSLDKNLEQRFEIFIKKFQKDLKLHEIQLETMEKAFKDDIADFSEGVDKKLVQLQLETSSQISEAASRMDEFMVPKLWLARVNSKTSSAALSEDSSLGLYKEEGKVNNRPMYVQISGDWSLQSTDDNKWILVNSKDVKARIIYIYRMIKERYSNI